MAHLGARKGVEPAPVDFDARGAIWAGRPRLLVAETTPRWPWASAFGMWLLAVGVSIMADEPLRVLTIGLTTLA